MLYAAIRADALGNAPENCRWARQVSIPVAWLIAFLKGQTGELIRRWSVDSYMRRGTEVRITTDACPYGYGGVLEIGGCITAWVADTVSVEDRRQHALSPVPSSSDQ